jgi:hypothetical protein
VRGRCTTSQTCHGSSDPIRRAGARIKPSYKYFR